MNPTLTTLTVYLRVWAARAQIAWRDDEGAVAEKVVIVAIFVALALAAGAIITKKVLDAANAINLSS